MKKGVQHINCNIFGCDLEETRFNFSWGPRAVRGSSESCGPLNHCSHELVGGGQPTSLFEQRSVTNESWNCIRGKSPNCPEMIILLSAVGDPISRVQLSFADLDQGWSNPGKFPICEYLGSFPFLTIMLKECGSRSFWISRFIYRCRIVRYCPYLRVLRQLVESIHNTIVIRISVWSVIEIRSFPRAQSKRVMENEKSVISTLQ